MINARFPLLFALVIFLIIYSPLQHNELLAAVSLENPARIRNISESPEPGSLSIWGTTLHNLDEIPVGNDYLTVATGDYHALALRVDGTLTVWGAGTENTGTFPHYGQSIIPAGDDYIAVAAGDFHSLALRSDGTLIAWGRNNYGQTNVPGGNDFTAIACGSFHSIALREDGTISAWGAGMSNSGSFPHYGQSIVPDDDSFVAVAGGATHTLALRNDGTLTAWGRNNYGQTDTPPGDSYVSISANNYHNLTLKNDGSVTAWGRNTSGQCNVPVGESFSAISAGREHSIALRLDGSLSAWGSNNSGQCDVPEGHHYSAVAAGYQHSIALSSYQYSLLSPNGGEIWQTETERLIRWYFKGENIAFLLQYTSDNGSNWNDITTVDSSESSYNWTLPSFPSAEYRVRAIFLLAGEEVIMESENNFTLTTGEVPEITILAPSESNLRLQTGSSYEILWNSSEVIAADIYFSSDNGYTWQEVVSEIPANSGSYHWIIPEFPTATARIKIQDSSNNLVQDVSAEPFSLVKLALLNSPDSMVLYGGENLLIEFQAINADRFRLKYSPDDGENWLTIASSLYQVQYNWLIPNLDSDRVVLRLEDYYNNDIYDESAIFSINNRITLLFPTGGENLLVGTIREIEWIAADEVTSVLIDYSADNGENWTPVRDIPYPAASGFYEWLIPDTLSAECLVKVKSVVNHNSFGINSEPFTISNKQLLLTSPTGGEVWYPGTIQMIDWEAVNVDSISIAFSYDNGISWLEIEEGIPTGAAPYLWEIPEFGTPSGKIRITDTENYMIQSSNIETFTLDYLNPPRELAAALTEEGVTLTWEPPLGITGNRKTTNTLDINKKNRALQTRTGTAFSTRRVTERRNSYPEPFFANSGWSFLGYNIYIDETLINPEPFLHTEFLHEDAAVGSSYSYYITALYDEGESLPSNTVEIKVTEISEEAIIPILTLLHRNRPNPFNPDTTISFSLAGEGRVKIDIFNIRGQRIKSIADQQFPAGNHSVIWDGKDDNNKAVGSGLYFYRMQSEDYTAVRKMTLLK
jgi:alpha-tubulin suppressor-like RCC1 family protein